MFLRLVSRGDRLVVAAVWLALVLLPERGIHQFAGPNSLFAIGQVVKLFKTSFAGE